MRQAHRPRQAHPIRTTVAVLGDSVLSSITRLAAEAPPKPSIDHQFKRQRRTMRMLVSHSTQDTNVRVLWQFIAELQTALDAAKISIMLVNVVSECGSMEVPDLEQELTATTTKTDLTMMVLSEAYTKSYWCESEMMGRAYSSCDTCPSRRLFPLAWRKYPWTHLWSRDIDGWGVDLQPILTDAVLASVEESLWDPTTRCGEWNYAISLTVDALRRFLVEIESSCIQLACPKPIASDVPIPTRLD